MSTTADRRFGCAAGHFTGEFNATGKSVDISGIAVVAMLDPGRHRGVGRYQGDSPTRARLHQCDADVRPVGVARGAVTDHRHEATGVRSDLQSVGGTQHHLEDRTTRRHRPGRRQHPFGMIGAVQSRPAPAAPPARPPRPTSSRHRYRTTSTDAPIRLPLHTTRFDPRTGNSGQPVQARQHRRARPALHRIRWTRDRPGRSD